MALTALLPLFGSVAFVHGSEAQGTLVPELVAEDARWTVSGSPYRISAPTTIAEGATVSVEPGATVEFDGASLIVEGALAIEPHGEATTTFRGSGRILSFGGTISLRRASLERLRSVQGHAGATIDVSRSSFSDMANGIGLYGARATVADSTFRGIAGLSVSMYRGEFGEPSGLVMRRSDIGTGGRFGLYVEDGQQADARENLWGHDSGPYHAGLNPQGLGANIYGAADIFPILPLRDPACCSSVLFLPGLKASRLYVSGAIGETKAWEPSGDHDLHALRLDEGGASIEAVYAKEGDVISEPIFNRFGPDIYRSFIADIDAMRDSGRVADWRAFAYDWRLDPRAIVASDSAGSLVDMVRTLAEGSITGRVSVVGHSNGGIVAKLLARRLDESGEARLLDRIVLVATPQLGTPQAIGSLLHGFDEAIPLLASAAAARTLGRNMPSAYVLVPSVAYADRDARPFIRIHASSSTDHAARFRAAFGEAIAFVSDLYGFMLGGDGREDPGPRTLTLPSIMNPALVSEAAAIHAAADGWAPPVGVEAVQIAGWGRETMTGIEYRDYRAYGTTIDSYRPIVSTDGDGTVIAHSALAMPEAPNVRSAIVDLDASGAGLAKNRYHADILEAPEVRRLMRDTLLSPPFMSTTSFEAVEWPSREIPRKREIVIHSGEYVLEIDESLDADARNFGEVWYAAIPVGAGSGAGDRGVRIRRAAPSVEGPVPRPALIEVDEHRFAGLSIPDTGVATIVLDGTSTPPVIDIDLDGDGSIDERAHADGRIEPAREPVARPAHDGGARPSGRRLRAVPEILIAIDPPAPQIDTESVPAPMSAPQPEARVDAPTPVPPPDLPRVASPYLRMRAAIAAIWVMVAKTLGIR